jgi:hypothetical protein
MLYLLIAIILLISTGYVYLKILTHPSNIREWSVDQALLPSAEIKDNLVAVQNIRNFSYASVTEYNPHYYNKTYDLDHIKKVWYVLVPFPGLPGSAHNFLSFEFDNNVFLSVSMEIRKEKTDVFSPVKGLINEFELMYVVADEKDVIKLRTNYRQNPVYLYPLKFTRAQEQQLFKDVMTRANHLTKHPEFYNTLTNSCSTNVRDHINTLKAIHIPWSYKMVIPGFSDKYLFDLGLIDTNLPFEQARQKYLINPQALKFGDDPNFSVKIREFQS